MIVIVDYKTGNIGSLLNMLKKVGVETLVSSNAFDVERAKKLILPGVGAFDGGMENLRRSNLLAVITKKVIEEKTPILGVCLGMQLFSKRSEEGRMDGLGWVEAETIKFKFDDFQSNFKIPHMGWNLVKLKKQVPLFKEMEAEARFYFANSYHLVCDNKDNILATTNYGYDFASIIRKDNIYGVQFHPEKSHKFGMRLLKNFVELC